MRCYEKGPVPERGSLGNAWVVESSLLLGTLGALGGLIGSSLVGGSVSASLVGGRLVGSGLIGGLVGGSSVASLIVGSGISTSLAGSGLVGGRIGSGNLGGDIHGFLPKSPALFCSPRRHRRRVCGLSGRLSADRPYVNGD